MPIAVTTPAGRARLRYPPSTAPTGRATRNRTSTSAAMSWLSEWTVVRAKRGMSISAAIRAAPTKKLTASDPQAGVRRIAPRGTRGASARRRWRANASAAMADPRRYQIPWSENTWTFGSAVANARITPASAMPRNSEPVRSAARSVSAQPRRSTSGRDAVAQRITSSAAATIATTPTGLSHRPSETNGMNAWPQVRSRNSGAGWVMVRTPAARVTASSSAPRGSVLVAWGFVPARVLIASASSRPTPRLIAKITRQSANTSTTAPKSGPSTLPISWTAETTPRGTPRRSAG